MRSLYFCCSFVLSLSLSSLAFASYSEHTDAKAFIDEMVSKHEFARAELEQIFAQAEKKDSILEAIARPAEKRLEWKDYRKIFVTTDRIEQGIQFMKKYANVLKRAEEEYGVPAHIVTAIIGVETRYGKHKGGYRVVDALSTLAFDYPPRSKFFKGELEQALLLAKEQGFKPLDMLGSYAGAMGYGQFIPSSYRHYAVDFDGDGVADILNNPVDAIGSVANYFARHKWHKGQPVTFATKAEKSVDQLINTDLKPSYDLAQLKSAGVAVPKGYELDLSAKLQPLNGENGVEYWVTLHNFYVITRYNHSHLYAMAVYQLADNIKRGL